MKNEIKKTIADATDAVKHGAKDVKDAASEQHHRAAADAERERREIESDDMTSGEKLQSLAEEAKHRTQAELDRAKRSVRDETT